MGSLVGILPFPETLLGPETPPLIIINFAAHAPQIIWWRVNSIRGKEGRKSEGVERGVTRCLPPSRREVSEVSLLLLLSAFLERGHCVTGASEERARRKEDRCGGEVNAPRWPSP